MTKSDNSAHKKEGRSGPRFTIQFSQDIVDKVEEERGRLGINTASPVYQTAMKFYFENKDKRIFMSQEELDAYEDAKLEALLTDKRMLRTLKRLIESL